VISLVSISYYAEGRRVSAGAAALDTASSATNRNRLEGYAMSQYPEWVLRHKKKGTYINHQNGKYYLYAAHSERIPGTSKVRRVSDGYLGRITEEEGLIPPKRKLSEPVYVFECGLSETILSLSGNIRTGLWREFRGATDYVLAGGALLLMYGEVRHEHYETSWLSVRLPGSDMRKTPTDKQRVGMERTKRMMEDTMKRHFGDAYAAAVALLPLVRAVRMCGETVIAEMPDGVKEFLRQHGLGFKEVQNG